MDKWFGGQVDLEDRLLGLENVYGDSVLDLGCAEGDISQWFIDRGSVLAEGYDLNEGRVYRGAAKTAKCVHIYNVDLRNPFETSLNQYDIVLMLAILQKLPEPEKLISFAAQKSKDFIAVRTPTKILCDRRSQFRKIDTQNHLERHGFELTEEFEDNCWVGIFRRVH